MLRFRNLDVTPDSPVEEWGVEGLVTAIERGSLPQWQRIMRAVRRDPFGAVAADLEQALHVAERYGIVDSLRRSLDEARGGDEARVARRVRQAVRRSGLTAREFAAELGTSPSRLSTYVTGKVAPSAPLFLRIERLGDELAARQVASSRPSR